MQHDLSPFEDGYGRLTRSRKRYDVRVFQHGYLGVSWVQASGSAASAVAASPTTVTAGTSACWPRVCWQGTQATRWHAPGSPPAAGWLSTGFYTAVGRSKGPSLAKDKWPVW